MSVPNGSNGPHSSTERFLLLLGSLGPLGYFPASGTATVLIAGIPAYWALSLLNPPLQWTLVGLFVLASIWIHDKGDRILNTKDSPCLVWDELAGYFLAVAAWPFSWRLAILAFFIERTIDIIKVPPARHIERNWPGGLGVVADDLVAGLYARILLMVIASFNLNGPS